MRKKLSVVKRMLAFVLTFAMAFTAISWGDVGEVMADEGETNLLPSGSCDDDTMWSDWQITFNEGVKWDDVINWSSLNTRADAIKSGTGSWGTGVNAGADLYIGTKQDLTTAMEVGKTYLLSGFIKVTADPGNNTWINGKKVTPDDEWAEFSVEYTAKEADNYPAVKIWAPSGTEFYLDELSITLKQEEAESPEDSQKDTYSVAIDVVSNGAIYVGDTFTLTANVKKNDQEVTDLSSYHLYWWNDTADTDSWFLDYDSTNGQQTVEVKTMDASAGEYKFKLTFQDSGWKNLTDPVTVTIPVLEKVDENAPEKVESSLYVPYIKGITDEDGFIRGADVSSYYSVVQSGGKYYDANGQELNDQQFFDLLHESGVNTIRIRVWVDPYDAQDKGYGGGNNDLEAAVKMGQWASEAGMGVLIDFHYSDFWADPGKQKAPKGWENLSVEEKAAKISEYTTASLKTLLDANVNVTMVQVGNETNGSMCGVKGTGDWTTDLDILFDAGCDAVHNVANEYSRTIKAVLHFTNPESEGKQIGYAKNLSKYDGDKDGVAEGVSYDVFATSYYPYWHGTISNLTSVLSEIADKYGKEVMVAETSWATTLEDGDGHANTVRVGNNDDGNDDEGFIYSFSEQGQANEMTAVVKAMKIVGEKGLGVFFWEPTWIPVQYAYNEDGTLNQTTLTSNKEKWEQFGSGWASSYASTYDPNDAGKWFGGCAVDNENWFDFNGKAMEGIKIFKLLQTGTTTSATAVESIATVQLETTEGQELAEWPTTVDAITNEGKTVKKEVTWPEEEKAKVNYDKKGTYTVYGKLVEEERQVTAKVTVFDYNYLKNGSFENCTTSNSDGWNLPLGEAFDFKAGEMANNSKNGKGCLHFYSGADADLVIATTAAIVDKGTYALNAFIQGGGGAEINEFGIYAIVQGTEYRADTGTFTGVLSGWKDWHTLTVSNISVPKDGTEVIVALYTKNYTGGLWGSFDDVTLIKTGDIVVPGDSGEGSSTPSGDTSTSGSTLGTAQDKTDTAVTKNPDGTTTETKTETTTNESGKEVATTVTTKKDADGKVTGSTEVSTIAGAAKDTAVTVTVEKDAKGNVAEAAAEVTKKGTETEEGTKGTISAAVVQQIKEAAGSANVAITTSVTGADGKEKYSVTVDANDLVAGAKLTVVVKDAKTGKAVLVNAKQVKVTAKGNVSVVLPEGNDYTLIDAKEAAKVTKEILKTVEPAKTSATLKAGKTNTAKLSKKLDMDNVKKITYTTSKKGVVTVNKNGKVVAKKAGTATITIKVTLNNGKTKTVKMKYTVK